MKEGHIEHAEGKVQQPWHEPTAQYYSNNGVEIDDFVHNEETTWLTLTEWNLKSVWAGVAHVEHAPENRTHSNQIVVKWVFSE